MLAKIPEREKAFIAITIASIIWGVSSPVMKMALFVTPVFLFGFLRFFLAALLLLLFSPKLKIAKKDFGKIFLAGLFGVAFNISFFFFGLKLSSALNAGMLTAIVPIFTLVMSALFLKERINRDMILGSVLGLLGIFFILFEPFWQNGASASITGNAYLIIAALSWVGFEMISKQLFKKYEPLSITFYTFLLGSLVLLPLAFQDLFTALPKIVFDTRFLSGILYGVLLSSVAAYILWQWGLSKLDASRVGFFFYLDPVVGTIASVFLLGEKITSYFIFGAILIFLGLYLAEKRHPYSHLKFKEEIEKTN